MRCRAAKAIPNGSELFCFPSQEDHWQCFPRKNRPLVFLPFHVFSKGSVRVGWLCGNAWARLAGLRYPSPSRARVQLGPAVRLWQPPTSLALAADLQNWGKAVHPCWLMSFLRVQMGELGSSSTSHCIRVTNDSGDHVLTLLMKYFLSQ